MDKKEFHIGDGDRVKIERPFPWGLVVVVCVAVIVVGIVSGLAIWLATGRGTTPGASIIAPTSTPALTPTSALPLAPSTTPTPTATTTSTPVPTPTPTATPTPTPTPRSLSTHFTVAAGETKYFDLFASAGNRIVGQVKVEGGGNDVNFWIEDPFGNKVLQAGRIANSRGFAQVAATEGRYRLYFDNSFSLFTNKVVDLTVEVHWR